MRLKQFRNENVIKVENNSASYFPTLTTIIITIIINRNNKNILNEMQLLVPCDIKKIFVS